MNINHGFWIFLATSWRLLLTTYKGFRWSYINKNTTLTNYLVHSEKTFDNRTPTRSCKRMPSGGQTSVPDTCEHWQFHFYAIVDNYGSRKTKKDCLKLWRSSNSDLPNYHLEWAHQGRLFVVSDQILAVGNHLATYLCLESKMINSCLQLYRLLHIMTVGRSNLPKSLTHAFR